MVARDRGVINVAPTFGEEGEKESLALEKSVYRPG